MAAGIRNIAKHLGVSLSTVSSVINGRGYVSPEMRERVTHYLREVDYQPNYVARSLRRQETRIIGLIVPDLTNSFYSRISRGAEDFLLSSDYQLIVADSREDWARQQNYLMSFCRMKTDGILLVPSPASDEQIASIPALVRGQPLVYLDRSPIGQSVDSVLIDNQKASFTATQHLIDKGHRRIAILTEPLNLLCAADRLEGYRSALAANGIAKNPDWIHDGRNTKDSAYQVGLKLLTGRERPTAAVICNNLMTLGFLDALRERKLDCPEQFSLIGFDECEWSQYVHPSLTVIQQPASEIGAAAAQLLLNRVAGATTDPPTTMLLGFQLIERASTARLSTRLGQPPSAR